MSDKAINVLLIEDDVDETSVITRSLSEPSEPENAFCVKGVARLSSAARLLAREPFDVVLLDLVLPQCVGLEGFRELLSAAPELPIIVLTGLQDEALAAEAVREGAQDYLVKGTPDCCLLKRAIRYAIERKRLAKEVERLLALRETADAGRLRLLETEMKENMRVVEIKNQFMGRISHELRNSLATVKTAVFCLNDGMTGPLTVRQARLVEMISRNVDRQVKIIDNILDLSRFQSGKIKISSRPVDLAAIVDEIAQEFRIKNKPQKLEIELPQALPGVEGDPDLLVQVLRNLLENAFRFARSKVLLRVADAGADQFSMSVHDDGAGIPKERLGDLFGEFVQLERRAGGDGYKGTGLGLAICKEIVEGHRGRIWAESGDGSGTRFHVVLPKRAASAAAGQARALEPVLRPGDGARGARPSHPVQK